MTNWNLIKITFGDWPGETIYIYTNINIYIYIYGGIYEPYDIIKQREKLLREMRHEYNLYIFH